MGCGPSNVNIIPVSEAPIVKDIVPTELNSKKILAPIPRSNNEENTQLSVTERCNSFSSHDSGYVDNEYKNIITEKSNSLQVEKVEKEFYERQNLDLTINGRSCPKLYTAEEQRKLDQVEENKTHEILKNNGLVQTALVKNDNFVRFDVIDDKTKHNSNEDYLLAANNKLAPLKRLPPLLRKNASNSSKITQEEIAKKLEAANERKLQNLASIKEAMQQKNKPLREQSPVEAIDPEIYVRQKKLIEIRDQIRAKNANESTTPRTPRSQELVSELEKFRSKTPANFKPVFD
jgi:hypothetical protein